jgi:DNA-binding beta-propeller fold protein YncE
MGMRTHRTATWLRVVTIALGSVAALTPAHALCPGDCNGDGIVTVDEIVRGVNLTLGAGVYRLCPPVDVDGDSAVTVNELIIGVNQVLNGCPATVAVYRAPEQTAPAGPLDNGRGILPSGRRLTPAGVQIPTETLPLNVALTSDGRYLLLTNDGSDRSDHKQYLQVVDTQTLAVVAKTAVPHFFGLAVTAGGDRVFVGSDNDSSPDRIDALGLSNGALTLESQPVATFPDGTFPSGLALSPDGTHLYALGMRSNDFLSIELASGKVYTANKPVGKLPFQVLLSADGKRAYVSSWGINGGTGSSSDIIPAPLPPLDPNAVIRSSIAVIDLSDPTAPRLVRSVPIARSVKIDNKVVYGGSHPSAMRLSPDGALLYVTATNADLLEVLDTVKLDDVTANPLVADVPLNVFANGPLPEQPVGFYPNALAVSPDGRRIYVAAAGINAVQVVTVDPAARTFTPAGFIPTGWYPSALALSADGTRLYVANGKGNGVGPNGGPGFPTLPSYYIGALLKGSLSVIDHVDQYDLQAGQAQIVANNGLASTDVRWVDGTPAEGEVQRGNPVPIEFGSGPSDLIKYVVFIFKENRTYDQLLGQLAGGNGDPELADYGADVTPNTTALATEFAAGDNFFNDGEVSETGHDWADQANCTDFMEKMWPGNYDRNLPADVLDYGQERFAKGGFIFQSLEQQGIPFRVYGETMGLLSRFASGINSGGVGSLVGPVTTAFKGFPTVDDIYTIVNGEIETLRARGVDVDLLSSTVWPNQMLQFPMNILSGYMDVQRAQLFKSELDGFAASGTLPNFLFIWLPNDHTFGASQTDPTPRSAVADNDAGMGLVIDALSHSPFWPHMAIFVTEDDPQGGRDHVSAHRTISVVASPYVKRGYISHAHHSSMSMTKTMELLLGAQPLTQFDRYATDMRDYFTSTPDLTAYTARPRTFPPETNPAPAAAPNRYLRRAAQLSAGLNLAAVDEDGDKMARILALVHTGERVERQKARAVGITLAVLASLLGAGAALGRRRAAAARAATA